MSSTEYRQSLFFINKKLGCSRGKSNIPPAARTWPRLFEVPDRHTGLSQVCPFQKYEGKLLIGKLGGLMYELEVA